MGTCKVICSIRCRCGKDSHNEICGGTDTGSTKKEYQKNTNEISTSDSLPPLDFFTKPIGNSRVNSDTESAHERDIRKIFNT